MRVDELDATVLTAKDVIVLRGEDEPDDLWMNEHSALLQDLAARTGCMVLVLQGDMTLDTLDRADMARHGWAKCSHALVEARKDHIERRLYGSSGERPDWSGFGHAVSEIMDRIGLH